MSSVHQYINISINPHAKLDPSGRASRRSATHDVWIREQKTNNGQSRDVRKQSGGARVHFAQPHLDGPKGNKVVLLWVVQVHETCLLGHPLQQIHEPLELDSVVAHPEEPV